MPRNPSASRCSRRARYSTATRPRRRAAARGASWDVSRMRRALRPCGRSAPTWRRRRLMILWQRGPSPPSESRGARRGRGSRGSTARIATSCSTPSPCSSGTGANRFARRAALRPSRTAAARCASAPTSSRAARRSSRGKTRRSSSSSSLATGRAVCSVGRRGTRAASTPRSRVLSKRARRSKTPSRAKCARRRACELTRRRSSTSRASRGRFRAARWSASSRRRREGTTPTRASSSTATSSMTPSGSIGATSRGPRPCRRGTQQPTSSSGGDTTQPRSWTPRRRRLSSRPIPTPPAWCRPLASSRGSSSTTTSRRSRPHLLRDSVSVVFVIGTPGALDLRRACCFVCGTSKQQPTDSVCGGPTSAPHSTLRRARRRWRWWWHRRHLRRRLGRAVLVATSTFPLSSVPFGVVVTTVVDVVLPGAARRLGRRRQPRCRRR
mmetsp:Transcript_10892/g.44125  ORF Transcript_10892/g.44125 Transcript_10892/m.44125 type:complete len:439 (-) Transcript_10892:232-1548(-)